MVKPMSSTHIPDNELPPQPFIRPGIYRHYKNGDLYKVTGVGSSAEDPNSHFVIYFSLNQKRFWIREHSVFVETLKIDGKNVSRFEFVRENE